MADKKLSAYDVLSEMSGEDLIVALKSLGEGKYQNANVKLSKMAEALSKLTEKALANNDLSNLSEKGKTEIKELTNQKIENIENTKANVDLSNISATAKTTLAQYSQQAEASIISNIQGQIDILKRQMQLTRDRLYWTRIKVYGSHLKDETYEI